MTIAIKKQGHAEKFDEKKLYESVYKTALNCHLEEEESRDIAQKITDTIAGWINEKTHITTNELRFQVINLLELEDSELSMMYENHYNIN